MSAPQRALHLVAATACCVGLVAACNTGPLPFLAEPLDELVAIDGEGQGYVAIESEQTTVLVLAEGRYLKTVVGRDTSAQVQVGDYTISQGQLELEAELAYSFPKETGDISSKIGAQPVQPPASESFALTVEGEDLILDESLRYVPESSFLRSLELGTELGQRCLLRYVQIGLRTVQARTRNFGGGGMVIYQNNPVEYSGFLSGSQRVLVEDILNPKTTISYKGFSDFPSVGLGGTFYTYVNTKGDGHLDAGIDFNINLDAGAQPGGAGGAGGASAFSNQIVGRLNYGPDDVIKLSSGDPVGGSYELALSQPQESTTSFDWSVLDDLSLESCLP